MKLIDVRPDGYKWFEIETATEAVAAGNAGGQTTFGYYFVEERRRGGAGRWFVLESDQGIQEAFCRTPSPAQKESWSFSAWASPLVTARHGADPFPIFKDAIHALSLALRTPIDETCYPHRHHNLVLDNSGDPSPRA